MKLTFQWILSKFNMIYIRLVIFEKKQNIWIKEYKIYVLLKI